MKFPRLALVTLLLSLAVFFGKPAQAQPEPPPAPPPVALCDPASVPFAGMSIPLPWGTGSAAFAASTDKAEGLFTWCPQSTPAGSWHIITWQFNLKDVALPALDARAAYARVRAADDPASAVKAEAARLSVPLTNDMQRYELRRLRYAACVQMTTFPLPVQLPSSVPPFQAGDIPATYCGTAPTPPAPTGPTTVCTSTGTGTLYRAVAGKLATIISGRKVTVGTLLDCSKQINSGSSTYFPVIGGPLDEYTLGRKVTTQ